jgi:large subunit ribosomal protein L25
MVTPTIEMSAAMRHGSRVVELKGAVNEKALIRDLQWDTYGTDVVHVDFARVSEHERVNLKVKLELRGQAAGVKAGGVLEHHVHELEIECEALSIPEKLELNINELQIGSVMTAADLRLPPGVVLLSDPETILAQCVEPAAEIEELAPTAAESAEPEVIGRKAAEEEAEE